MNYYLLKPEVAGGFGERTVMIEPSARPPLLERFHYKFAGWLGDELLTTVACFIVTERVAEKLKSCGFSGFSFGAVEISKGAEFSALYPGRELPKFLWLKIEGKPMQDDFGIAVDRKCRLVVSERALNALRDFPFAHCEIQPI